MHKAMSQGRPPFASTTHRTQFNDQYIETVSNSGSLDQAAYIACYQITSAVALLKSTMIILVLAYQQRVDDEESDVRSRIMGCGR